MRKGQVPAFFIALLCFLAGFVPTAFAEQLPIRSYTSADGLGSSFVNALMRDSRGFLWVCTRDGLSRFDGSRFVTYQVGDKNAPPGIEQIVETRKGIYWIVTTGGLYRFDPDAPVPASRANSDARPTLNAQFVSNERGLLFGDHAGQLWASGSKLYRVNDSDKKVSFEPVDLKLPNPSLPLGVASIAEGNDGSLWLATFSGLLRRLPDGREIFYSVPDPRANPLTSVLEDHEGRIWLGRVLNLYVIKPEPLSELSSLGTQPVRDLNQLARKQAPFSEAVKMPLKPGEIFEYPASQVPLSGRAKFLYQTADTHIWISNINGLVEFDGRFFKSHEGVKGLLQGPGQMAEDASGNLWLGGANALVRVDRSGLVSYANGLKDPYIVTINRTRAGALYVGDASMSLSLFDGKGFQTIRPRVAPDARALWTANTAFQDSRGEWWFLTDAGLYRFAATDDLQQLARQEPRAVYDRRDGFKSDAMFRIFEDSHSDLWISTRGADGFNLARWSRGTEKFQMFSAADGLPAKPVSAFAEDKNGDLWVGFTEGGVARFTNDRFTEFPTGAGLDNVMITSLLIDRQGRLWIASTENGVGRVDDPHAPVPHVASINVDNGLGSNNVRSLGEDLYGNIYVGTARGLNRISPDGTHIRHYSVNDGLAGDFVTAVFRDVRGMLWFGTPNGLSRLEPVPEKAAAVPPIWISGLRVAGQSRPVAELGSLDIASFDIGHDQNNLQIEFFGIDFSPGESLHYQYKLEGADHDWSAPTLQRVVSYASLAPGVYRFVVRAINADGVASTAPAAISFRILPPFWRRWWFIVLSMLTVGAALFALDRYRVARMKELDAVNRKLKLEYDVTRLLAESSSTVEAAPKVLQAICETLRWEVGAVWDVDRHENVLRCVTVWLQPEIKAPQFEEQTRGRTFAPGEGLPGRVWSTAAPLWISDLASDQNFPRVVGVSHEGLRSGFGFPILVGTEVVGVIEFFKRDAAQPDEALLEMMTPIGAEIGQLLVRKQNEEALRESETRFRTLAETASDAIITIDEHSTIIYINQAAENIFGYRVAEILGEDLTMLMPEYLRHVHRAGLSRYVETGRRHISWSAVELPGLHKDGREVPLELSFGEFTKNERRYFTGIARDITERKRAEEALRDAHEERFTELERVRKRIATDLHDDIGSALTQISILSEVVHRRIGADDSPVAEPLALIADSSRELVDSMSDIVWAINPNKDRLNDLLGRMRRFAADMLTARSIEFQFQTPDAEKDVQIGANIRREVFLIFKESINNLVKHSGCSRVEVRFQIEEDYLELTACDNGKGFDTSAESDGHGLSSMRDRAASLGAEIGIVSESGRGTIITLNVPLGANSLASKS